MLSEFNQSQWGINMKSSIKRGVWLVFIENPSRPTGIPLQISLILLIPRTCALKDSAPEQVWRVGFDFFSFAQAIVCLKWLLYVVVEDVSMACSRGFTTDLLLLWDSCGDVLLDWGSWARFFGFEGPCSFTGGFIDFRFGGELPTAQIYRARQNMVE